MKGKNNPIEFYNNTMQALNWLSGNKNKFVIHRSTEMLFKVKKNSYISRVTRVKIKLKLGIAPGQPSNDEVLQRKTQ